MSIDSLNLEPLLSKLSFVESFTKLHTFSKLHLLSVMIVMITTVARRIGIGGCSGVIHWWLNITSRWRSGIITGLTHWNHSWLTHGHHWRLSHWNHWLHRHSGLHWRITLWWNHTWLHRHSWLHGWLCVNSTDGMVVHVKRV